MLTSSNRMHTDYSVDDLGRIEGDRTTLIYNGVSIKKDCHRSKATPLPPVVLQYRTACPTFYCMSYGSTAYHVRIIPSSYYYRSTWYET